jgi:ABC-type uncharacterized transport system auxiliary subunit
MKNIAAGVFLGVFLCGCGLLFKEPYNPVNYYDLSYPEAKQGIGDMRISVANVKADKPYSDKMVFRVSDNRIEIDEFNRWSCNPSDLIGRYFSLALAGSAKDGAKSCLLSAEILRLEANLKKSSVNLTLQVSIQNSSDGAAVLKKTYSKSIPVEKVSGESFAKGVETAMGNICVELSRDLQKITP